MMMARSRASSALNPSPAPRERVARDSEPGEGGAAPRPSRSHPFGLGPSLSRSAGEGLWGRVTPLVDASMAVEMQLAPMGVAVGEIDRESARRGRPAAADLVLAELEAVGQHD